MSRAARFRRSDAERAIRAAEATGQKVRGVRIEPDGTIEVLLGEAIAGDMNTADAIVGLRP